MGGFLYWCLNYQDQDAVCHAFTYDRTGEKYAGYTLAGIFLTLSGDGRLDYPVATKGLLRFLGETADKAAEHSVVEIPGTTENIEESLRSRVGGYLLDLRQAGYLREAVFKKIEAEILPDITNHVTAESVPPALIF